MSFTDDELLAVKAGLDILNEVAMAVGSGDDDAADSAMMKVTKHIHEFSIDV